MASKSSPAEVILQKLQVIQDQGVREAVKELWLFETQGSQKGVYKDFYREVLEKAAMKASPNGEGGHEV